MSRAFTKEIDDAPPSPRPDRAVSSERNLVTPAGAIMIEGSVAATEDKLRRADGQEIEALKRELKYWEVRRATMEEVAYPLDFDRVRFGSSVQVLREGRPVELEIVGEDEADPKLGKIAWTSPLAKLIEGAAVGEEFELELPSRSEKIKIMAIGARPEPS